MSSEIAVTEKLDLAVDGQQTYWSNKQVAILRQIGVEKASEGDLAVFHHVCQRTGLDPFARQIYMIEREGKQTIQTGIDGFRLVARRAVDRTKETLSIEQALWCGEDGQWRDVWLSGEPPAAAKITVTRGTGTYTAVALYAEYVQRRKRDGGVTRMWESRPAGQIAKCAEALALRKAFPQDLSGIYSDDEMAQADSGQTTVVQVQADAPAADRMNAILGTTEPVEEPEAPAETGALNTSSALAKHMFAALNEIGISEKADRLRYVSSIAGREIASSTEMTEDDAQKVITAAEADLARMREAGSQ